MSSQAVAAPTATPALSAAARSSAGVSPPVSEKPACRSKELPHAGPREGRDEPERQRIAPRGLEGDRDQRLAVGGQHLERCVRAVPLEHGELGPVVRA